MCNDPYDMTLYVRIPSSALAAAALALLVAGCATTYRDDLRSLQADPMAQADIPVATLTRTSEHDAQLDGLMGKQEAAEILYGPSPVNNLVGNWS